MKHKETNVKPVLPLSWQEITVLRQRIQCNPDAQIDPQVVARLLAAAEAQTFLAATLLYRQRQRALSRVKIKRVLQ